MKGWSEKGSEERHSIMDESMGSSTSPARDAGAFRSSQNDGQERSPAQVSDQGDRGVLNKVKQKASDWSEAVVEKTKDLAQKSKESVKEFAHTAGEKVDDARTAVGEGMERFGGGVREKGSSASAVVGGRLEAAGAYIREHDFSGMTESVKDVVRRHPVQSVLVGIGMGFVLARAMRRG
jgi:ElaB/YqjD/DUF883 family membrane-anchored ribosome-binding protein